MTYCCKLEKIDSMWLVSFPDLSNIQTYGGTEEEALFNAGEALNGSLESDVARGILLPEAKYHDENNGYPIEVDPHIVVSNQIRNIRGSTAQTVIAQRLNITYQSYQLLENPVKGNPTIKKLEKVARAMGKRLEVTFSN